MFVNPSAHDFHLNPPRPPSTPASRYPKSPATSTATPALPDLRMTLEHMNMGNSVFSLRRLRKRIINSNSTSYSNPHPSPLRYALHSIYFCLCYLFQLRRPLVLQW
jgi:hypothetical protein